MNLWCTMIHWSICLSVSQRLENPICLSLTSTHWMLLRYRDMPLSGTSTPHAIRAAKWNERTNWILFYIVLPVWYTWTFQTHATWDRPSRQVPFTWRRPIRINWGWSAVRAVWCESPENCRGPVLAGGDHYSSNIISKEICFSTISAVWLQK